MKRYHKLLKTVRFCYNMHFQKTPAQANSLIFIKIQTPLYTLSSFNHMKSIVLQILIIRSTYIASILPNV